MARQLGSKALLLALISIVFGIGEIQLARADDKRGISRIPCLE